MTSTPRPGSGDDMGRSLRVFIVLADSCNMGIIHHDYDFLFVYFIFLNACYFHNEKTTIMTKKSSQAG